MDDAFEIDQPQEDLKPEKSPVQEFDLESLRPTEHEYVQRGSELVCMKPGHHHSQRIRPTLTLTQKEDGSHVLVDCA